jgi:DNA repair protein RadC
MLLDVPVTDHVILGEPGHVSLVARGVIPFS